MKNFYSRFQAKVTWFLARLLSVLIDQIAHGRTWPPTLNPALIEFLSSMTTNTEDVTCTRDLVAYEKALRFEWRVKRAGKERAFPFACLSRVNQISIESCYCRPASGQGCRFTRVVMENCSTYFHIKQDIKEHPFEGNPVFTITQIITYLSILQAISGSERKTFQSKTLTFTNFYIFITKTNPFHFDLRVDVRVVTGIFAFPT